MRFFNFDIKKALLIATLVLLPLSFMTFSRSKAENHFIFRSIVFVSSQTLSLYHSMMSSIQQTTDTYLNLIHTKKQNRQLAKENKLLLVKIALLEEKERENKRLSAMLNFKDSRDIPFLPAQVIGQDPLSQYQLLTINRGKSHGVRQKMVALTKEGVAGYVYRALSRWAQVILLTDPRVAFSAIVKRSRVQGVIEGAGGGLCQLKYLNNRDDVQIGDVITTSGLSLLAPKGLLIGEVIKAEKQGLTQNVVVKPFVTPSQLEEVLIVLKESGP